MTFKIYKDEFTQSFVNYIIRKFKVVVNLEKSVTISCTEKDAENIMSQMYKKPQEINKEIFKGYLTVDEQEEILFEQFKKADSIIMNALLSFIASPSFCDKDKMSADRKARYEAVSEMYVKRMKEIANMTIG